MPRTPNLGTARRRWGEEAIRMGLFVAAMISVLTTLGIVASLLTETIKFFQDAGVVAFITDGDWKPLFADPQFGIWPLINGTLLVTAIAIVVAIPVGLGSAIYLSEYAKPRTRRMIKPVLEVLVGVPTVVLGFFALTFVTPTIVHDFLGLDVQVFNALSAGLVMGIMIVPTIASVSEDAMSAVPVALREGAFGLGSSKLQTSTRVVAPAALSGIVAAIVLGVSRGIGETMIALIAAGQIPNTGLDPTQPFETITTFIGATAKGDNPAGTTGYYSIFACGMTLFVLTLIMNAISIRFVRKYRQAYE
ncbi:MAG TPA: phosphate ABC transporter permease subunit PstC [Solirubrobacterales bacterium]|nr:phosphate ABC transporter permease subunit PstC [Solirubrobacterales bacterium]